MFLKGRRIASIHEILDISNLILPDGGDIAGDSLFQVLITEPLFVLAYKDFNFPKLIVGVVELNAGNTLFEK